MPSVSRKDHKDKSFKPILKKFKAITKCPENFLSVQQLKDEEIRTILKETYGLSVSKDTVNKSNVEVLPEIFLEGLDEEQIWQQLELRNNVVWPQFLENTSKLISLNESRLQISYVEEKSANGDDGNSESDSVDGEEENDGSFDKDEDLDELEESDEEVSGEEDTTKKLQMRRGKPSIVDDKFFKLSEMEAFLEAEDKKELQKQQGKQVQNDFSINYFDENFDDDDEEENIDYKDFFDDDVEDDTNKVSKSKAKRSTEEQDEIQASDQEDEDDKEDEEDKEEEMEGNEDDNEEESTNTLATAANDKDSEQEDEVDKPKSSFEERQERLNQRIEDYEQEILGEKPWQLKGEIQASNRPQNSLLEEILEFEATTRPAPIITEETNLRLEDIIRQRIKDQAWDDVELKVKPLNTPMEYRKQLVLDQEKSKESLAQIYEKQYQKEIEKLDPNAADTAEEEPKEHKEIKEMMRSLFVKLDALSNFHFTPKPVAPEPKIITNTPAVNMEEVAPVAVSNAKLLAPEEIRKRAKGDILGSNERNKTDKNRDRRHKKQKQRAIFKAFEERDIRNQKMGIQPTKKEEQAKLARELTKHRNISKGTISKDGPVKTSKEFFKRLQETAVMQKNAKDKKKLKTNTNGLSAKKLKL